MCLFNCYIIYCYMYLNISVSKEYKEHKDSKDKHKHTPLLSTVNSAFINIKHRSGNIYKLWSGRGSCNLDKKHLVPHFKLVELAGNDPFKWIFLMQIFHGHSRH